MQIVFIKKYGSIVLSDQMCNVHHKWLLAGGFPMDDAFFELTWLIHEQPNKQSQSQQPNVPKQPNNQINDQINNQMFKNKQKTNQQLNVKKAGTEDKWTNYIDKV